MAKPYPRPPQWAEPRGDLFDTPPTGSGHGYMHRASPFSLDSPQADMASSTESSPRGNAAILYPNEGGDLESIPNLNPDYFRERCPLLAQAFEPSRLGPRLYLEVLSPITAAPFVRYLYTGSYAVPSPGDSTYEDVPTSVLLHCQLFRLGAIYDLPDLRQQAYVNVTRQCEFGCSSPDVPIELCAAIKYAYEHLREHTNLIDTIICYCVTCFLRHGLGGSLEFRNLAFDLRPFHQDLAKECMRRGFKDDAALAIIQMPFRPFVPETYASRQDLAAGRCADVVHHFHGCDDYGSVRRPSMPPKMAVPDPGFSRDEYHNMRRPSIPPGLTMRGPGDCSTIALTIRQKRLHNIVEEQCGEQASNVEDLGIGSSKRGRSAAGREACLSSDSEFEIVPEQGEELSWDSGSDPDTLVLVESPMVASSSRDTELPIRTWRSGSAVTLVEPVPTEDADTESDFEWIDV